ncbi:MAG: cytidine deaminase [Eubacteriales bacterium]|nr:cytidine deaminase [Eubacteriales bacterium]
MTNQELIKMAHDAYENAYAPYSHFYVGAALLTAQGKVYKGCNIENASYGATNCAERTAIYKAVSEGEREFCKIAVVAKDGSTAFPCGICLQVMNEFMPNAEVLLEVNGEIKSFSLKQLLPYGFQL